MRKIWIYVQAWTPAPFNPANALQLRHEVVLAPTETDACAEGARRLASCISIVHAELAVEIGWVGEP